jgi:hypothetical protein
VLASGLGLAIVLPRRYFDLDEANRLIPTLELAFARVMRVRTELKVVYRQLEQMGHRPTAENLADERALEDAPVELRRARGLFRALVETLSEDLAAIESAGAEIKDAEMGLVDFWTKREGKDVLLCWQYGEKAIAFWHTPEAGFAGRKPLEPERVPARTLH